jgi:DNA end-binding protein Ku
MKVVEKKVKAGDTETVIEPEEEAPAEGAEIIDLTELLTRSLKGGKAAKSGGTSAKKSAGSKTSASAKKTGAAAKKAPRKKTSSARRKAA